MTACDRCLARGWLLALLAGHIETERGRLDALLACADDELVRTVGGTRADDLRAELGRLDPGDRRARAAAAGLHVVCRCAPSYPAPLRQLRAAPAALYLTAAPDRLAVLLDEPAVAIVGARRPSPYGRDTARSLASGLAGAGVTVVSGLALGIDGVAHDGALRSGGATIAVLAGGADRPYPAAHRRLYERIRAEGVIISELPPGVRPRRWMFPARNRIIAGLSAMTVVVQARTRSGALVTARHAAELGRAIGAVPGPVSSPLSAGPHALIAADGARLIAGAQDAVDALFGPGRRPPAGAPPARLGERDAGLLDALREGHEGTAAFTHAGLGPVQGLEAIAALELAGLIRREPGGRLVVAAPAASDSART